MPTRAPRDARSRTVGDSKVICVTSFRIDEKTVVL